MPHSAPEASTPACQARRRRSRPAIERGSRWAKRTASQARSSQTIAKPVPQTMRSDCGATPAKIISMMIAPIAWPASEVLLNANRPRT